MRQEGLRRRGRWGDHRRDLTMAQVEFETLGLEFVQGVGAEEARDHAEIPGEARRLELKAVGQGEVNAFGGEASIQFRLDLDDTSLDLGVGEQRLHAGSQRFRA